MKAFASWLAGPRRQGAWRAVLAALLLVVAWLALTPTPPGIDHGWDKLNHAAAFAALAFASQLGFRGAGARLLALAVALCAFGGAIEVLQSVVPGRSAEWADLLADVVGIAAGAAMGRALLRAAGPVSALGR